MKISCTKKNGFTLIELLVVVIIIGVLASIAIPGYMRSVEKTKASTAMQALSDIAKAEHDYFAVQSRYTDDFGDLTITLHDEETKQDADNNSYSNKHFTFELDEDLEAAKATRSGGDAPYTLYRLFDDPRIYCQPADNKYCQMLDLPAGSFNTSIGNWQSCPGGVYPCSMTCSRSTASGFTCYGTYNEDGTYSEKVCQTSGTNTVCTNAAYNADGKKTKQITCDVSVTDKCVSKFEQTYDEDGNILSAVQCSSNYSDGSCSAYSSNYAHYYTYDANGNMLTMDYCNTVDNSGNCTAYSSYRIDYTYDANGNRLTYRHCYTRDSNGNCTSYSTTSGYDYTYDANGNRLTQRNCSSVDSSSGNCTAYSSGGYDYTYDANGNRLTERYCSSVDSSSGNCTAYSTTYNYTYDTNGNMLTQRRCSSTDSSGNCTAYSSGGGVDYTYDANGNRLTELYCSVNSEGNCVSYSDGAYYTYDANRNKISQMLCSNIASNGSCNQYAEGTVFTYDENGNQVSSQDCRQYSGTTCTKWKTIQYKPT